ncbi:histidine phosphatase family protein [Cytobacillus spongiae]|uniref:histidine phosphatase family protein n=1 Tax=Cytobacillus spongiae TaxID=2901381 RepID=UPI001F36D306|nr:histidine phosphatase family protein [Cytobacillus spongiae]UII56189.1 histidine phosphatase family protein [Cytobacillus spongiae]
MASRVAIALFRHGITEDNERHAYLGWKDAPLSDGQRWQAHSKAYEKIYSSDLIRCVDTVRALFPKQEIQCLKQLRELNFGDWDGQTYEELKDVEEYQAWLGKPFETAIPNGESYAAFSKRVEEGWDTIVHELVLSKRSKVAICTHGGVIRYLLTALGNEEKSFWEWRVPFGEGYELIWDSMEQLRRGERCTLLLEVPLTEKQHG